jgi:GNAT superfamily N-acetyltransferase
MLIELMRRASLVWDDTRADLMAHPELIDVPADQIAAGQVIVAGEDVPVGFAAMLPRHDGNVELDGLFVEPSKFRHGTGRALVDAAGRAAKVRGAKSIHVIANRNVLGFYLAVGFRTVGEIATPLGPTASLMIKTLEA